VKLLATVLFAIAICAEMTTAQEPSPPSEAEIRGWIDQLANKSAPRKHSTPSDRLSKEEKKSLEPVREAFRKLTRHFLVSLPYLVEHLNDKRFSYPREHPTSGVFYDQNVGHACHAIIQGKVLQTGLSFIDDRDISVWVELPLNKDWYNDVSKMNLFEMQVDAIDRLLKAPKLNRVTTAQWEEGLMDVRKFRDDFVKKGEAIDLEFGPPIEGK
jgi:hypothetical protein